jgi:hypothetical protein
MPLIQGQNEGNRIREVLGLIQQSLAMEGAEIVIEIEREEV